MLRKSKRPQGLTVICFIVLQSVPLVTSFSEHLEAAEEEYQFDDRTHLDVFGESAKEFLTKRVIPETDEECRWDWRYARCEPNCVCVFDFRWGDFHLGRSCRKRSSFQTPDKCDMPPDTPYAKFFDVAVHHSRSLGDVVKQQTNSIADTTKKRWEKTRATLCIHVPADCDPSGEVYQRSLKEKWLCGHIAECNQDILDLDPPDTEMIGSAKGGDWSWF